MRAGRDVRPEKRARLHLRLEEGEGAFVGWERERGRVPVVKGFEDEVLVREVEETFGKVASVVDWMERVWQDLVETGKIGGEATPEPGERDAGP